MRRPVRLAGMVGLVLIVGACHWGTYKAQGTNPSGATTYSVSLHQSNTDDTIAHCAGESTAIGKADCALDVVRYACHADPITGWSTTDCDAATNHATPGHADPLTCRNNSGGAQACDQTMKDAITAVDGVGATKECLAFEWQVGGPSQQWFGADTGFPGCS